MRFIPWDIENRQNIRVRAGIDMNVFSHNVKLILLLDHEIFNLILGDDKIRNRKQITVSKFWLTIFTIAFSKFDFFFRYENAFPPLPELRNELEHVRSTYDQLCKDYQVVYCHGDPHTHNTIYDPDTGTLSVIVTYILTILHKLCQTHDGWE